jgi:hypothetical protein
LTGSEEGFKIETVGVVGLLLMIGGFFSLFAPLAVHTLYSGEIKQSSPNIVGFEGVMTLEKLETIIFGNHNTKHPRLR